MISPIEWLTVFILHYPLSQYLIIFLGAAFVGELALFTLGFLTAQGILSIFPLIIFSFLGVLASDILWFLLGKTAVVGKMISHRYTYATVSIISKAIDRTSKGNRFVAVVLAKFLIGTRILLIIYLSKTNLEFKRFVYYDAMAIFFWLIVIIPIGVIAGHGFTILAEVFHNLYLAIGFILFILLIIVIVQVWLERYLSKKADMKIKEL